LNKILKFCGFLLLLFIVPYLLLFLYIESVAVEQYTGYEKYADREIDALVVFFGDFGKNGDPGRESLRRLHLAVELYKRNIGKNIIFVGGRRPSRDLSGSRVMAQRAVAAGIKSSNIFYDMSSRDTLFNWREAEKIIIGNNFKEVIVISSIFHLIRIERIIKMRNGIRGFFASYGEANTLPPKSLREGFCDYNYNLMAYIAYLILPSCCYQAIIHRIRD
jgi:uncharacterized SAM-binding protein YcdF (DUF218 family)